MLFSYNLVADRGGETKTALNIAHTQRIAISFSIKQHSFLIALSDNQL